MTANFEVTGGSLPHKTFPHGVKQLDNDTLTEFWDVANSASRRGVYVFGIRAAKGWRPLYVGCTKEQTFKARIGQQRDKFNAILARVGKGTPYLFLIGRVGKGRDSNAAIDDLEIEFINYAFAKNPDLENDRGIETPGYQVHGFGDQGKPSNAAYWLKLMIGYR